MDREELHAEIARSETGVLNNLEMLHNLVDDAPRPEPQIRYRLNVTNSVKGVRTTDATVEYIGSDRMTADEFMSIQVIFQAKVDEAYPPPNLTL